MNLPEKISRLHTLLSSSLPLDFHDEEYYLPIEKTVVLKQLEIPFEQFGQEVIVKLKDFFSNDVILVYANSISNEINAENYKRHLLCIDSSGTIIEHTPDYAFIKHYEKKAETFIKFSNAIEYQHLFDFFIRPPFSDYFNDSNEEIVIYNEANGIIKIVYDTIPKLPFQTLIKNDVKQIIANADPVQVAPFFKNALYKESNNTGIVHIDTVLKHAKEIVSITKRDYELVSKKFDFEKFRDSVYKEKEKYFTSVRDIINKIFGLAVGIPISISASVFATYKVSDNDLVLLLVFLAYALYVAFYIKIQMVYKNDLAQINDDFIKSFEIIKAKSGLDEALIESEKGKIERKFKTTDDIIFWLVGLVAFLSLLFAIYVFCQMFLNETISFFQLIRHSKK